MNMHGASGYILAGTRVFAHKEVRQPEETKKRKEPVSSSEQEIEKKQKT